MKHREILEAAGLVESMLVRGDLAVRSPIDGTLLGHVASDDKAAIDQKVAR